MNPQKYCISLDLARRLHELGVKEESMFYWCYTEAPLKDGSRWVLRYDKQILESWWELGGEAIPAYTSGELGEMLPNRDYLKPDVDHDLASWVTYKSDGEWHCSLHWRYSRTKLEFITAATEAEARGLMLEYLIKNGFVTL